MRTSYGPKTAFTIRTNRNRQHFFHHLAWVRRDLYRLSEVPLITCNFLTAYGLKTVLYGLQNLPDRWIAFFFELWKTTSLHMIDLNTFPRTKPGNINSMEIGHCNLPYKLWGRKVENCATTQRHSELHLRKRMQSEEAAIQKADNHFQSSLLLGPQGRGAGQTPSRHTGLLRPSDAGPLWGLCEGRHLSIHVEDQ